MEVSLEVWTKVVRPAVQAAVQRSTSSFKSKEEYYRDKVWCVLFVLLDVLLIPPSLPSLVVMTSGYLSLLPLPLSHVVLGPSEQPAGHTLWEGARLGPGGAEVPRIGKMGSQPTIRSSGGEGGRK